MKPPGIRIHLDGTMRVVTPTAVEDIIWRAVEEAIDGGWTVEKFRREAAMAWDDKLGRDKKDASNAWEGR